MSLLLEGAEHSWSHLHNISPCQLVPRSLAGRPQQPTLHLTTTRPQVDTNHSCKADSNNFCSSVAHQLGDLREREHPLNKCFQPMIAAHRLVDNLLDQQSMLLHQENVLCSLAATVAVMVAAAHQVHLHDCSPRLMSATMIMLLAACYGLTL